jgi:hypothetical protein
MADEAISKPASKTIGAAKADIAPSLKRRRRPFQMTAKGREPEIGSHLNDLATGTFAFGAAILGAFLVVGLTADVSPTTWLS